jgi:Tol biopolymer transport system component
LIAFGSGNNLYVVPSSGGRLREVVRAIWTGADYVWGPDGTRLFVSVQTGDGGDLDDLFVVNPDGTRLRRLTHGGHSANLSLSPDGKLLAFEWTVSVISGPSWIDIANADGTDIHRLTNQPLHGVASWSPSGKRLAVDTLIHGIYVIDADGNHLHRITNAAGSLPVWSPVGSRIAFSRFTTLPYRSAREDVFLIGADGRGLQKLVHRDLYSRSPAWSPDATRIAFSGTDARCESHHDECSAIFVVNADGTDLRRLTPYAAINAEPSWSTDGRRIAYMGSGVDGIRSPGEGSIYVMNADGTNRHPIAAQPQADDIEPLAWQPTR